MKRPFLLVILLIILILPSYAQVSEWWVEEGSHSYGETTDSPLFTSYPGGLVVDWQRKVAISKGAAALAGPMTIENRAKIKKLAREMAIEKLILLIGFVRIDGFTRLSDAIDRDFSLNTAINKLIRKTYNVVHEKVYKDQSMLEVTVEFELTGKAGLSGTLFPVYLKTLPPSPATLPASRPSLESTSEACTGLIVDASNLGIEGGLVPNIFSENGEQIFNLTRNPDKSVLILDGVVDYAPATGHSSGEISRAGENPLIISAKSKLKSPYNCDIVVTQEDAERIKNADAASYFLRRLRVVILL